MGIPVGSILIGRHLSSSNVIKRESRPIGAMKGATRRRLPRIRSGFFEVPGSHLELGRVCQWGEVAGARRESVRVKVCRPLYNPSSRENAMTLSGLCAAALVAAIFLPTFAHAQSGEGKTAEQVYKNIVQMKGTPADQLGPAMQ